MKRLLTILAASALFFLASCSPAATIQYQAFPDQSKVVEDPAKGRIYVIRPAGGMAKHTMTEITVDGKLIGLLGPGSFLSWEVEPGTVKVISTPSLFTKAVDVEVKAGEQYFLQNKIQNLPFVGVRPWMQLEDSETGKKLLSESKPGQQQ